MVDTVSPSEVSPSPRAPHDMRARGFRLVALAALLAGLIRLPYVWTGLSTDEGGYAYVVQQWSRGARIYDTAWLDRPQGLLLTYRALLGIDDSGWTIRLGVILAGMIITVAVAAIAWLLGGRRAGLIAAFVYAIAGLMPRLEGMTLNGELLAGVPAAISIALAVYWWRRHRRPGARGFASRDGARALASRGGARAPASRGGAQAPASRGGAWWLAAAGLFAGLALAMKQSGIDGFIVGVTIVTLAGGPRWRSLLTFLGGFALPVLACVAHGLAVGWPKYWTALLGYQLSALGGNAANSTTRWHDFTVYAGSVAMDLGLIVVVAAVGVRFASRDARWVLGAWLVAGLIGINLGGSYWPHYYVQIVPPLIILAAIALAAIRPVAWRTVAAAVVVLPTLGWMAVAAWRPNVVPYHSLAVRDDRVAAYIDRTTRPSDQIYVLESEAYLYFAARRTTSYPYLWGKPIQKIGDALPKMRAMLASPNRPELVIMDIRDPDSVDPSGAVADDLSRYYHYDTTVDGVVILRANR